MSLTAAQLQSLIARNADDIRRTLKEIKGTAEMLTPAMYRFEEIETAPGTYRKVATGGDDYNKPFFAILSKLQRKRAKLEQLQRNLRDQLKEQHSVQTATQRLRASGYDIPAGKMLVMTVTNLPT